jgi:hypothetical protein
MKKISLLQIILSLLLIGAVACSGVSQQPMATPKIEGTKVTVKGKIDYMKNLGGYIVSGENPPSTFFIVNQNPKVLEELFKSQKGITIDGHLTIGTDHLFIEKIDGQPYRGK